MSKVLSSTLGSVYPNMYVDGQWEPGYAALRDNPGFFHTPPYQVGSITVGNDTYAIQQHRYAGSNEILVFKNGVQISAPLVGFEFSLAGFCAYVDNDIVNVFYVSTPDAETINEGGQIWEHTTGPYTYHSIRIATATWSDVQTDNWEDTPSIDPTDPNNLDARGGEFADTMPFGNLDNIDLSEIDIPQAQDYGRLITCYVLDPVDMQNLGDALFLADFWTNMRNKFSGLGDPLEFIFSCKEIALNPSYIPTGNRRFKIGGVPVLTASEASVNVPATLSRFTKTSLGSFDLKEVFGTAKDYSDVDISIYLPYAGVKQLDPDIVVGNRITLVVLVDIWTGDILYEIHTNNKDIGGKYYQQAAVVYRFSGNCATNLPIGKVDNTGAIMKLASGIIGVGAGLALGGVAGAAMGASAAGAAGGTAAAASAGEAMKGTALAINTASQGAQGIAGILQEGFRPTVQTSDGVSGALGLMDLQYPYLIIKRGVPQYPIDFRKQIGAPRFQTLQISGLHGYTRFSALKLEYMGVAVAEEIRELERLLMGEGVIL